MDSMWQISLVLTILISAVILFAWEKFSPDIVALLVLITLALTGLVSTEAAFSGFASPAVVTVWAIYIVSEGLFKTGVADFLSLGVMKLGGKKEWQLILVIMLMVGLMSAFMNNIGATAVLLPVIPTISKKTGISSSKFLIPLSFASLMGGNMTLIGTPPNILASEILQASPYPVSFGFFDFAPMGIIILLSGTIYMVFIGRHLLPTSKVDQDLAQNYNLRNYVTEIKVLPTSPLIGKTLVDSRLGEMYDLTIINRIVERGANPEAESIQSKHWNRWQVVHRTTIIQANDTYLVQGQLENILKIKQAQGLELSTDQILQDERFRSEEANVAEAVVTTTSHLVNRTLKENRFRENYSLNVLAIWRDGHPIQQEIANIELQFGDVLLLQGSKERLRLTQNNPGLLLLEPISFESRRTTKVPITLMIMALMLGVVSMGWLHISVAAVIAAVAMVLTGVLSMDEAYQAIQWRSIFLIAGMLPLGIAMDQSGTAEFLAANVVGLTGRWGPTGVLVGIYLLTLVITQPMSNAAATVLIAPIAINVAATLNLDPRPFIMAVVIAASTAFLTPIGHQANVLVYGVGGYKFTDFTKVGLGLNLMYLSIVILILPLIWPYK